MGAWGSFDCRQYKQWSDKVQRALKERVVESFAREVLHEIGNQLLARTKRKTPTDTGLLKRNWQISRIVKKGNVYEIEVFNNTEYAPFVENGHRIVSRTGVTVGFREGVYMLGVSAIEIERIYPKLLERRTNELMLRIFGG